MSGRFAFNFLHEPRIVSGRKLFLKNVRSIGGEKRPPEWGGLGEGKT
jgi:hypothetical protein